MYIIIICQGSGCALSRRAKTMAKCSIYLESIPQPRAEEEERQTRPSGERLTSLALPLWRLLLLSALNRCSSQMDFSANP